jgi:hypothetical protein
MEPQFKEELFKLNLNSLKIILVIYLLIHICVYLLFILNKKYAYDYLKIMVWIIGPCMISFGLVEILNGSKGITLLFPLQGILYLYVGIGFLYLKKTGKNRSV